MPNATSPRSPDRRQTARASGAPARAPRSGRISRRCARLPARAPRDRPSRRRRCTSPSRSPTASPVTAGTTPKFSTIRPASMQARRNSSSIAQRRALRVAAVHHEEAAQVSAVRIEQRHVDAHDPPVGLHAPEHPDELVEHFDGALLTTAYRLPEPDEQGSIYYHDSFLWPTTRTSRDRPAGSIVRVPRIEPSRARPAAAQSTIFQKESLRLILPSVNSNRSHPRTSIGSPVAWVPRIVHSDTPRSPHVQWRSSP